MPAWLPLVLAIAAAIAIPDRPARMLIGAAVILWTAAFVFVLATGAYDCGRICPSIPSAAKAALEAMSYALIAVVALAIALHLRGGHEVRRRNV